jgi:hypothetical protein
MAMQRRSSVPEFTAAGVVFQCWVVGIGEPIDVEPTGQGGVVSPGRYEWRSEDGRLAAGRDEREFWAAVDGRRLPGHQYTLLLAMQAAVAAMQRTRRRA